METKMGVYICTGCGLGDALDMDALAKVATGEYKAPICRQHAFLCSSEAVGQIKSDFESEGVNALVIAACSPRVMTDVFDFGPDKIMERVNLREQVVCLIRPMTRTPR